VVATAETVCAQTRPLTSNTAPLNKSWTASAALSERLNVMGVYSFDSLAVMGFFKN
jgi:hypothetical protein